MKIIITLSLILTTTITSLSQDSTYTQQSKLIPSTGLEDYGSAVDIEDEWVMIGGEDTVIDNVSSGTVYVYKNENGILQLHKKLLPSDGSGFNRFGNSISIENSTMVVGAWSKGVSFEGTFYPSAGKVYVYEEDEGGIENWGEVIDIQSPVPTQSEYFGFCVDIGENVIAVGAYGKDDVVTNSGIVYLYGRDIGGAGNWGLIKSIKPETAGFNYNFGTWVEVSDSYLAVSSPNENGEGKVFIYYKNEGGVDNWGLKKTLSSPNPGTNFYYGDETSLDGDRILVGALKDFNTNFFDTGRSYVYAKDEGGIDNWGLIKTFEPSELSSQQEYGVSVDLNGDYLIIAAEEDDEAAPNAGAAYIYRRNEGGIDNWGLVEKVFDCEATGNDDFGTAVAINGNQAIIGADDHNAVGDNSGAAYFYNLSPNQLHVNNTSISSSNSLMFQSGMTLTSDDQINESGKTVKFKSIDAIELQNSFSVNAMTGLECFITGCH